MTEDHSERIQELNRTIENWQRVHNHELHGLRSIQADFKSTLTLTSRVVFLASAPAIMLVIAWSLAYTGAEPVWLQVLSVFGAVFLYAVVATGAARASALAAHLWFRRGMIPERVVASSIALFAALFLLLCLMQLFHW